MERPTKRLLLCSAIAVCSWASPAFACDTAATATPESTCVVQAHEGTPGVWFELETANALRKAKLTVPELSIQLTELELKLSTREWQLDRYREVVKLKDRTIATQTQSVEIHARREREAREALDAWHRSPLLWTGVGAVVASVVFVLARGNGS